VLNEEQNIFPNKKNISEIMEKIGEDFEILFIDDGSTDNTWEKIVDLSYKHLNCKGIKLSRNYGHHHAILIGLEHVLGDAVLLIDGDLQDDLSILEQMFSEYKKGAEVVLVERNQRVENFTYLTLQKIFYRIIKWQTGDSYNPKVGNFSLISKQAVEAYISENFTFQFFPINIQSLKLRTKFVSAKQLTRIHGKSSYKFGKRIELALNMILSFSQKPLYYSIYIGIITSMLTVLYFIYILLKGLLIGFAVIGWLSIMASIFFFGSILLTILSLSSLYIAKNFEKLFNQNKENIKMKINFEK